MFRRTTRQSPFWAAAALLALLAAPHTLLAQNATPTVRADVTNWTGKPVEFALVGPDGKDLGPPRTVQYRYVYRTSSRTLPGGSTKGYKWVVREPDTRKVLKEVPADRAQISIKVGIFYRIGEVPKETGSAQTPGAKGQGAASGQTVRADVDNHTAKPVEFALVGPDGKDLGPPRSVQAGKLYQTSNRTLPGGSARGYKWVVREPDTGRVLKEVPADRAQQSITVGNSKRIDVPAGSGSAQTPPVAAQVTAIPEEVRKKFNLDPSFYKKHIDYKGFSILSSARVSDKALLEARYLIDKLLGDRQDILKAMIKNDCRFMVMAPTEMTTDVPDQRHMKNDPKIDWNERARGLGGPLSSCGEENLLNLVGDRYRSENILIHEFNHAVHLYGLKDVDPTFDRRLEQAYNKAMAKGLWKGTYLADNRYEYWAEGTQAYFDCMRPEFGANTREKLKAYDSDLFSLVDEVYRQSRFRYVRYDRRK
jgi:alpha-glucosidase